MNQYFDAVIGLMIPFIGTTLGAAVVYMIKKHFSETLAKALMGFAAGVMVAASVWSLILPAIEQSAAMGAWSFLPAASGFWAGVMFLMLLNRLIPRLERHADLSNRLHRTVMMSLAVTLHNIPEGMAVGIAYAGCMAGVGGISAGGALALATGIAIQNIPEGAIISLPMRAQGNSRNHSFVCGMLSGAVEPVFGLLTLLFAGLVAPVMPCLLSFAAGAMMYVVAEELIPESSGGRSPVGTMLFTAGFTLMMALDVALG